ncbi:BLOC-1-related complex subunit 5-like [Saccostrea cucullata]|uniref:BLOC-1-related complex subunit 5-like n=1 Tax=Saccostrea cuccullata TaxID=36930 RepID=UPI002ED303DA
MGRRDGGQTKSLWASPTPTVSIRLIVQYNKLGMMQDKQKKYNKHADQFQQISETLSILNRVKDSMQNLVPKMERLNQMLPPEDRLELLSLKSQLLEPDVTTGGPTGTAESEEPVVRTGSG